MVTALEAAEKNERSWIGIDIAYIALDMLIERLLRNRDISDAVDAIELHAPSTIEEAEQLHADSLRRWGWEGQTPQTIQEAEEMAQRQGKPGEKHGRNAGRFEFQRFACSLVQARPNAREVGDGGIDGIIRFPGLDLKTGHSRVLEYLVEVKSGKIGQPYLDRLLGTITNRGAVGGLMLTLHRSETRGLRQYCLGQGEWEAFDGKSYPKLQICSVEEILEMRAQGKPALCPKLPTSYRPYAPDKALESEMQQKEIWFS